MNKLNPTALNFWILASSIGYYVNDLKGLALGLAISSTISLVCEFIHAK